jgi:uncharacterized protein with FMN-binding domain
VRQWRSEKVAAGAKQFGTSPRVKKIALSLFVIAASGAYGWNQSSAAPAEGLPGSALLTGDVQTGGIQRRVPNAVLAGPRVPAQPVTFAMLESIGSRGAGEPTAGALFATAEPGEKPIAPTRPQSPLLAEAPPLPPSPDFANPPLASDSPPPVPSSPQVAVVHVSIPRPRPAYHATRVDATRAAMTIAASSSYPDGIYTGPVVDAYYGLIQIAAIIQGGQLVGIKVLKYPSDRRTSVFINRQALPLLQDEVISAQSANVDIISGATLTSEAFIRSLGAALRKAKS